MISPKHGKRNSVNKLSPIEPENNEKLPLYKEDEEFGKYLQDLKMRATRNQKVDMYHNMDNMMIQDSASDAVNICDVNQTELNTVRK